jgi:hypothetical protein
VIYSPGFEKILPNAKQPHVPAPDRPTPAPILGPGRPAARWRGAGWRIKFRASASVASQIRAGELAAVEMEKNKGAAGGGVKVLISSSFLVMQPGLKLFDHLRQGLFHNL